MGFRYRKSIHIGGGFRVNISSSGIGYSWGVPGYRITKTANGRLRTTASIPGTGISYVEESTLRGAKKKKDEPETHSDSTIIQTVDREYYEDSDFLSLMKQIKTVRNIDKLLIFAIIVGLLITLSNPRSFLTCLVIYCFVICIYRRILSIKLDYVFTDEKDKEYQKRYRAWRKLFACDQAWYIRELSKTENSRTSGGAEQTADMKKLLGMPKLPFYLQTDVPYFSAALSKKESIYILPDKIFYINKGKLSAYDIDEVDISATVGHLVVDNKNFKIPPDMKIDHYTWVKVNSDGTRDKRYRSNWECPVCDYGRVRLTSYSGLNILFALSDASNIKHFNDVIP